MTGARLNRDRKRGRIRIEENGKERRGKQQKKMKDDERKERKIIRG